LGKTVKKFFKSPFTSTKKDFKGIGPPEAGGNHKTSHGMVKSYKRKNYKRIK